MHTFGQCASQSFTQELVSRVIAKVKADVACRVHYCVRDVEVAELDAR